MTCRSVALCSGKDCRSRDEYRPLRRALAEVAEVVPVRCLDLCDSPVVVVSPRSADAIVVEKVRTDRQRDDLVELVRRGGRPSKALRARIVTGNARKKALSRLR